MDDVEKQVIEIIARITEVAPSRIAPATDLRGELNVDSLQALQIVAALEKHFDVIIPEEEIDHHTQVQGIVDTVRRHCGAAQS